MAISFNGLWRKRLQASFHFSSSLSILLAAFPRIRLSQILSFEYFTLDFFSRKCDSKLFRNWGMGFPDGLQQLPNYWDSIHSKAVRRLLSVHLLCRIWAFPFGSYPGSHYFYDLQVSWSNLRKRHFKDQVSIDREMRCLRNKIHTNLFITFVLSNSCWIGTAVIQVRKGFLNTLFANKPFLLRHFLYEHKKFILSYILISRFHDCFC